MYMCCQFFSLVAILANVKQYLIVILICKCVCVCGEILPKNF